MEENNTSLPASDHVPSVRLGASLREARTRAGMSVADVAAQIRLAPRQIEALEAEEFQNLPELPFLRGFVRSYAKLLQIDAEPLLSTLPDPHPLSARIEPVSVDVPFNIQQLSAQQNRIWLIASVLVLVVVIALALWQFNSPKVDKIDQVQSSTVQAIALPALASATLAASEVAESSEMPASAVSEQPVPIAVTKPVTSTSVFASPTAVAPRVEIAKAVAAPKPVVEAPKVVVSTAKPAVVENKVVVVASKVVAESHATDSAVVTTAPAVKAGKYRLVFSGESWVEVKDPEGKVLYSQIYQPGSELNLSGKTAYAVVIGHAKLVQIYRGGKVINMQPYINSSSEVARLTLE